MAPAACAATLFNRQGCRPCIPFLHMAADLLPCCFFGTLPNCCGIGWLRGLVIQGCGEGWQSSTVIRGSTAPRQLRELHTCCRVAICSTAACPSTSSALGGWQVPSTSAATVRGGGVGVPCAPLAVSRKSNDEPARAHQAGGARLSLELPSMPRRAHAQEGWPGIIPSRRSLGTYL